jgi:hypothetical protein
MFWRHRAREERAHAADQQRRKHHHGDEHVFPELILVPVGRSEQYPAADRHAYDRAPYPSQTEQPLVISRAQPRQKLIWSRHERSLRWSAATPAFHRRGKLGHADPERLADPQPALSLVRQLSGAIESLDPLHLGLACMVPRMEQHV